MHTNFTLEAKDWGTDVENLPLLYTFLCRDSAVEPQLATPLWTGTLIFSVTTLLPSVGASLGVEPLLIMVRVSDINGAWTMASTWAHVARATQAQAVELLPMLNNVLLTHVDHMSRVGDVANAQIRVGLIAHTLNAEAACNKTNTANTYSSACLSGDQSSRQILRVRLLLTIQALNYSLLPDPQSLTHQALILKNILHVPAEISFEASEIASDLSSCLQQTYQVLDKSPYQSEINF